eukprot:jgi/Botrbrau1/22299/Bobra.0138s0051.1
MAKDQSNQSFVHGLGQFTRPKEEKEWKEYFIQDQSLGLKSTPKDNGQLHDDRVQAIAAHLATVIVTGSAIKDINRTLPELLYVEDISVFLVVNSPSTRMSVSCNDDDLLLVGMSRLLGEPKLVVRLEGSLVVTSHDVGIVGKTIYTQDAGRGALLECSSSPWQSRCSSDQDLEQMVGSVTGDMDVLAPIKGEYASGQLPRNLVLGYVAVKCNSKYIQQSGGLSISGSKLTNGLLSKWSSWCQRLASALAPHVDNCLGTLLPVIELLWCGCTCSRSEGSPTDSPAGKLMSNTNPLPPPIHLFIGAALQVPDAPAQPSSTPSWLPHRLGFPKHLAYPPIWIPTTYFISQAALTGI